MPIYDYKCPDCKIVFEELVKNPSTVVGCPNCQKKNAKKIISPRFGISFRGSGFYTTDYKNKR